MLKSKYLKSAMNGERIWRLLCWAMLSHSVVFDSFQPHGLWPVKLLCPWGFSRKNTRVGCHAFLQGIFPTQGLKPGLLHCRQILYHLRHQGSPRILDWVAYPFSRGSSQPRNWTRVSCIAGGFFTSWATREADNGILFSLKKEGNSDISYNIMNLEDIMLHEIRQS